MKRFLLSTPGGKAGAIDGLNLFFGALLGANLGTLGALPLYEYVKVIILLATTVMTLRMVSTSERQLYRLSLIGLYGVLLAGVVMLPALHPKGMSDDDLHRLVATLAIWIVFVVASELSPVTEPSKPEGGASG